MRTWLYVLARNALVTIQRRPAQRRAPLPLSDSVVNGVANQVRSTTAVYLRTEVKDAVACLRRQLDPLDQDILLLRIGRRMSWLDIAKVLRDADGEEVDHASLKRQAARFRKRFQRSKSALEDLAREEGLIS